MLNSLKKQKKGAAAILSIVIITSAALIMAISASMLGLGELDLSYISQKGEEALYLSDGCMEEAYRRIKLNTSYGIGSGDISLNLGNGSCIINITDLGGGQRRITSTGSVSTYNKKIQSEITLSGNNITVDSWSEQNT